MAKYKVLYWHDIPTQVRAEDEQGRRSVRLSERFQEAIDAAAMAGKLLSDDDYTDGFQWQREQERPGGAEDVANAIAKEIEDKYSDEDLKALVDQFRPRNHK
jgi:hypothetical protein